MWHEEMFCHTYDKLPFLSWFSHAKPVAKHTEAKGTSCHTCDSFTWEVVLLWKVTGGGERPSCHILGCSKVWEVAWPSGLRRWFKAPVSSEAWVRIPPLPIFLKYGNQRMPTVQVAHLDSQRHYNIYYSLKIELHKSDVSTLSFVFYFYPNIIAFPIQDRTRDSASEWAASKSLPTWGSNPRPSD